LKLSLQIVKTNPRPYSVYDLGTDTKFIPGLLVRVFLRLGLERIVTPPIAYVNSLGKLPI